MKRCLFFCALFAPVVIVHVPPAERAQVLHAPVDIREEAVLLPGQIRREGDVIGHVVAPENAAAPLRQLRVLHHEAQLLHEPRRGKRLEFSPLELVLQLASAVQHEAQRRPHGGPDGGNGLRRSQRVAAAPRHACQPEDGHDRKLHPRRNDPLPGGDGFLPGDALPHSTEGLRVAALHAVVQEPQPGLAELLHLLRRFPQDVPRRCVGGDPLQQRKRAVQLRQNGQQPVRIEDKRIPVGEEYPPHGALPVVLRQGDLAQDGLVVQPLEAHAPVHIAVGAPVVRTAPRHPQDEAPRLAGRAEYGRIVRIKKHSFHRSSFRPFLSIVQERPSPFQA